MSVRHLTVRSGIAVGLRTVRHPIFQEGNGYGTEIVRVPTVGRQYILLLI